MKTSRIGLGIAALALTTQAQTMAPKAKTPHTAAKAVALTPWKVTAVLTVLLLARVMWWGRKKFWLGEVNSK